MMVKCYYHRDVRQIKLDNVHRVLNTKWLIYYTVRETSYMTRVRLASKWAMFSQR